jgi:hypothetical protein
LPDRHGQVQPLGAKRQPSPSASYGHGNGGFRYVDDGPFTTPRP